MTATKNDSCFWNMRDNNVQFINDMNIKTGLVMVTIGIWLLNAIMLSSQLCKIDAYHHLSKYILFGILHRSVPDVIQLMPYINVIFPWPDFSVIACDAFGFCKTFLAVYELETFMMICIERYVHAKYVSKGWRIPPYHYRLYGSLSFLFSFMYAFSPLVGIGRYAKDFNCHHCTFDMILPEVAWKRIMVVTIFFMTSIKPAIIMMVMIYWARRLDPHIRNYEQRRNFTRGVQAALYINLVCGLPITLIRGTVIVSQLIYDDIILLPDEYFIALSICIHWVAPLPALYALYRCDTFLCSMTKKFFNDYINSFDVAREVSTEESANNDNDNGND